MSIATLSRSIQELTPQDELIGSLTKERVTLAVRYAGANAVEGITEARLWLAYALGTEVTAQQFHQVAMAYEQRERLEDCDLEFWYEVSNTAANRAHMQDDADQAITYTVLQLTNLLCTQLGVQ